MSEPTGDPFLPDHLLRPFGQVLQNMLNDPDITNIEITGPARITGVFSDGHLEERHV